MFFVLMLQTSKSEIVFRVLAHYFRICHSGGILFQTQLEYCNSVLALTTGS